MTTNCALLGTAIVQSAVVSNRTRRNIKSSYSEPTWANGCGICGQLDVAREVPLHPMSLTNRDCRQPIEKSIHHLHRGLRRRVANATRNDNRSVPVAAPKACAS